MLPRFQADENLNAKIIAGLIRRESSLDFQTAKAAGILGLSDPEVLAIAAREGRILSRTIGRPCRHTSPVLLPSRPARGY